MIYIYNRLTPNLMGMCKDLEELVCETSRHECDDIKLKNMPLVHGIQCMSVM